MHHETRGLVDDDQIVVLIGNREREILAARCVGSKSLKLIDYISPPFDERSITRVGESEK
jgi:hypothetical protein